MAGKLANQARSIWKYNVFCKSKQQYEFRCSNCFGKLLQQFVLIVEFFLDKGPFECNRCERGELTDDIDVFPGYRMNVVGPDDGKRAAYHFTQLQRHDDQRGDPVEVGGWNALRVGSVVPFPAGVTTTIDL